MAELGVVVPFYNEEKTAGAVALDLVNALRASGLAYEVALVADGSTDGTVAALEAAVGKDPNVKIVCDAKASGYGAAILHGFSLLSARVIGWTDGDGQVPGQSVVEVHRAMSRARAGVGMGLRHRRQDGAIRSCASHGYNWLMRRMLGVRFNDINAKPKLFDRDLVSAIAPTSHDWFLDTELVVGGIVRGVEVARVPVPFLPREHGASKVSRSILREYWRNLRGYRRRLRAGGFLVGSAPLAVSAARAAERDDGRAGAED